MRSMAIEVFNRYEHKYLLSRGEYEKIICAIEPHMESDRYNEGGKPYTIANIYCDTPDDYLIRRSLEKPLYKEKLRLRSYGVPNKDSEVFIEIKKKFNGLVNKRRSAITLSEAYEFLASGKAPEVREGMNAQVLKEIEYFVSFYRPMPKLYLAYDRIAFFERGNSDVRISFDTAVRSRRYDLKLESGDYGAPLLADGKYLMEIKTSLAKPLWLVKILSELNIRRSAFSKYGAEFAEHCKIAI